MEQLAKAILAVFLLSLITYMATSNLLENPDFYREANKFAQMILSIDKVDLFEATGATLPWSGPTYLIYLAVNTREAEDIIARFGELTQTIDKEDLAVKDTIPKYDVVIKVRPVKQQCIYGADPSTRDYCIISYATVEEKDAYYDLSMTESELHNKLVEFCKYEVPSKYASQGVLAGWQGQSYCQKEGWPFPDKYHCRFVCLAVFKKCDTQIGSAKLTTVATYTKDNVTVVAGPKSATGTLEASVGTGKSTVLYYGNEPVGKIDYVGSLFSGYYCPEGASYYIVNYGTGTKVIPETVYDGAISDIQSAVNEDVPECSNITSWDAYNICVEAMKKRLEEINDKIWLIRNWSNNKIAGKKVEDPIPQDYRSDWYVAITPDKPIVYPTYRLYLKASWVGILTKVINVQITKIEPSAVNIVGPETKKVAIHLKNYSSVEGGVTVEVKCTNNFRVNGQDEYSTGFTLNSNEEKVLNVAISYAGGGREKASGTCTVTAYPTANPLNKVSKTFYVSFTPKGIYPPNAVVCIDAYTKARTDEYGNVIPGTEERCPEGYKCVEKVPGQATCEKELGPVGHGGEAGGEELLSGSSKYIIPALVVIGIIIGFIIG